jgi:hypothetical protein
MLINNLVIVCYLECTLDLLIRILILRQIPVLWLQNLRDRYHHVLFSCLLLLSLELIPQNDRHNFEILITNFMFPFYDNTVAVHVGVHAWLNKVHVLHISSLFNT